MKEKIKNNLKKLNFKKISIFLFIVYLLAISILIFVNKNIGTVILLLDTTLLVIELLLYTLKQIIDDIEKMAYVLLIMLWVVVLITCIGKLMIKFIPISFPSNQNEMFQLFTSSLTTIISALIGIMGTYFGAVYGGRKTLEAVERQIKKAEEENQKKEIEKRQITVKIITKFLKEEIIDNKFVINSTKFYEYLKKGFKTQYAYNLKNKIKVNDYERIKYDLIKYSDEKIVEDVIELYELLYLLARHNDINEFDEIEYRKIIKLESKVEEMLNEINK